MQGSPYRFAPHCLDLADRRRTPIFGLRATCCVQSESTSEPGNRGWAGGLSSLSACAVSIARRPLRPYWGDRSSDGSAPAPKHRGRTQSTALVWTAPSRGASLGPVCGIPPSGGGQHRVGFEVSVRCDLGFWWPDHLHFPTKLRLAGALGVVARSGGGSVAPHSGAMSPINQTDSRSPYCGVAKAQGSIGRFCLGNVVESQRIRQRSKALRSTWPATRCYAPLLLAGAVAEHRAADRQRREGTGRGDVVLLLARGTLRRVCAPPGKGSRLEWTCGFTSGEALVVSMR